MRACAALPLIAPLLLVACAGPAVYVENALLYRELASAYDGMGEIEKSLKAFRRAQELD